MKSHEIAVDRTVQTSLSADRSWAMSTFIPRVQKLTLRTPGVHGHSKGIVQVQDNGKNIGEG